jgi:uncharacterized protein YdeI (BOF family)
LISRRTTVLLLLLFGMSLTAASRDAARRSSVLSAEDFPHEDARPRESIQTFLGTILKNGDRFVLSDDARKIWYELDDQQAVSKFIDKKVKVTGTLDTTKNLIRVQSIEEAT